MRRLLCSLIALAFLFSHCASAGAAGEAEAPFTPPDAEESPAESPGGAQSEGPPAEAALSLLLYRGGGMFQAGSFGGPQTPARSPAVWARYTSPEDALYNDIVSAMEDGTPQSYNTGNGSAFCVAVDISAYGYPAGTASMDAVYQVYARAVNDDPDRFYFVPDVYFSTDAAGAFITGLFMVVNGAIYAEKDAYAAEKTALLEDAFPEGYGGMEQTEIALALHDYLALHLTYDSAAASAGSATYKRYPNAFSAYGAIVDKKAVCHGIALAYKALLAHCGIPAYLVPDYGRSHVWNLIGLDGGWYHADITNALGTHGAAPNTALHGRFLLSDAEQGRHYPMEGWAGGSLPAAEQAHPCAAFWRDVESGMFHMGGAWYYNNGKGGKGTLMRSAYGPARSGKALYAGVSFPARILGRLYFYDYGDGGVYAFSPSAGIRTARASFSGGLSEVTAGAALSSGGTVPYEMLFFTLANGSEWRCYEGAGLGDVDENGSLNVLDILALFAAKKGGFFLAAEELPRAELCYDQLINEKDAKRIAEMIVGLAV